MLNVFYSVLSCISFVDVFFFTDRPQPTNISNSVMVPQWKKELAERRKNRPETINGVQMSNKENEPKTSPEIPQWKKEIVERRKRRETSPIRVNDKVYRSPETPEWKQRLSNNRRTQPIDIPRGPSEDSGDQVPSFMKEFEKKKRTFPRGNEMNVKPVPFSVSRRSDLSVYLLRRRMQLRLVSRFSGVERPLAFITHRSPMDKVP